MKRLQPERQLQCAVGQLLDLHRLFWWAVPNGGSRNMIEAVNLKRMGVKSGVSDINILHDGRFYALELKTPGGKATKSQIEWQSAVFANGGCAGTTTGLRETEAILRMWGLIR